MRIKMRFKIRVIMRIDMRIDVSIDRTLTIVVNPRNVEEWCENFGEKKTVNKKQIPGNNENEKGSAFHNFLFFL